MLLRAFLVVSYFHPSSLQLNYSMSVLLLQFCQPALPLAACSALDRTFHYLRYSILLLLVPKTPNIFSGYTLGRRTMHLVLSAPMILCSLVD